MRATAMSVSGLKQTNRSLWGAGFRHGEAGHVHSVRTRTVRNWSKSIDALPKKGFLRSPELRVSRMTAPLNRERTKRVNAEVHLPNHATEQTVP
jgi:hypothetical protein